MKSITLIGYMCVGKTTVGKALAKSLGCTFYDLDTARSRKSSQRKAKRNFATWSSACSTKWRSLKT